MKSSESISVTQHPVPPFFAQWRDGVTQGDDPAAISRAIDTHRRRLGALPDHLGGLARGDPAAREHEWGLIEDEQVVIVPDSCVPQLRALVVPKIAHVLPTDLPEAALHRLGHVVDAISDAFRRVTGVSRCRCWVPHPQDCNTRRLHLFVDPELPAFNVAKKQAVWGEVAVEIGRVLMRDSARAT